MSDEKLNKATPKCAELVVLEVTRGQWSMVTLSH